MSDRRSYTESETFTETENTTTATEETTTETTEAQTTTTEEPEQHKKEITTLIIETEPTVQVSEMEERIDHLETTTELK